jgi:hypothetical protein
MKMQNLPWMHKFQESGCTSVQQRDRRRLGAAIAGQKQNGCPPRRVSAEACVSWTSEPPQGRSPQLLHILLHILLPRAPGRCSHGLGTCLSLVRRANKSSWPTSSSLTVSRCKVKIINTHTEAGKRGGIKRHRSCGTRTHTAQGCGNLATYKRCVRVSRTQIDKYRGWEQSGLDGGRSQRAGLVLPALS